MAGPDPVVSVTAKFSDGFRWGTHQSDIRKNFIYKKKIPGSKEERFNLGIIAIAFGCFLLDSGHIFHDDAVSLLFGDRIIQSFQCNFVTSSILTRKATVSPGFGSSLSREAAQNPSVTKFFSTVLCC